MRGWSSVPSGRQWRKMRAGVARHTGQDHLGFPSETKTRDGRVAIKAGRLSTSTSRTPGDPGQLADSSRTYLPTESRPLRAGVTALGWRSGISENPAEQLLTARLSVLPRSDLVSDDPGYSATKPNNHWMPIAKPPSPPKQNVAHRTQWSPLGLDSR